MLSIFDRSNRTVARFKLLVDALISLSRQWTLRSEFWHETFPAPPPETASDGIPSFYTISPFRPRGTAFVNGLVLSLAVFSLTCFAIRYSWIHVLHVRIPELEYERPSWTPHRAATSGASPSMPKTPVSPPPEKPTAANVVPLPQAPSPAASEPRHRRAADAQQTNAGKTKYRAQPTNHAVETTAATFVPLELYAGTYVVDSPTEPKIVITVEDENLMMSVSGQPELILAPVSETKFVVSGMQDCWVEFSRSDGAEDRPARELQLSCNGERYSARRQP
jgi:hypothetical protein